MTKNRVYTCRVYYATHSGLMGPTPISNQPMDVAFLTNDPVLASQRAIEEAYRVNPRINHVQPGQPRLIEDPLLAILYKARATITRPDNWSKDASARNADGEECDQGALDPDAIRWCMAGACELAAMELDLDCGTNLDQCYALLLKAQRYAWPNPLQIQFPSVAEFNDSPDRQHSEVLRCFQIAIEHQEASLVQ